jgi:hypothetical protein
MNIFSLFEGLVPTPNGNTFPLPWQPIAHQKKQSNTCYSICTCIDRLKQKYRQNVHKSFKKAKMGAGGQAGTGGWDGSGRG